MLTTLNAITGDNLLDHLFNLSKNESCFFGLFTEFLISFVVVVLKCNRFNFNCLEKETGGRMCWMCPIIRRRGSSGERMEEERRLRSNK